MSQWTYDEIKLAMEKLIEKSAVDSEFRKLCLVNPNEALKQIAKKDIPEGFTVKLIENEASVTVVLPEFKGEDGELSDSDLDQVAGGKGEGLSDEAIASTVIGSVGAAATAAAAAATCF